MAGHGKQKFGDIDFYQAKKRIKKRFGSLLTGLRKTVRESYYAVQVVQQFRECLEVKEPHDYGRLPIYTKTFFSPRPDKISCVLYLIGSVMHEYWMFCGGTRLSEVYIIDRLDELENIAAKGLDAFRIAKASGYRNYYLERA